MEYTKPRIVLCGDAQSLIQGGKSITGAYDAALSRPQHPVYNQTLMAYEADE